MFSSRHQKLVFTFLMSIYMVTIMTFVITLVNTGMADGFLLRWFKAFAVAWPVAFVLILVGGPRIQKLAGKLIRQG
ncbi:DUF2798 domain-containing protein [Nitrincola schmidtii]|uniref:DUF2798 domain-containing protein n=1 Tax=Nitrincola schmidtii TaxID=1730894 RepID=UPI00124DBA7C